MTTNARLCALLLAALAVRAAVAEQTKAKPYKQDAGPHEVEEVKFDWKDDKRNRDVPVKLYAPKGKGPFPVVVFSHGLGGSREGYAYLGKHWAGHGYVVVVPQHLGSDEAVWKGKAEPLEALKKAVADPQAALQRPPDVRFVLDQAERLNKEDERWKGRLDMDKVGMGGHSFGAWTTLAMAGQTLIGPGGRATVVGDARVKAALPLSVAPPKDKATWEKSYASIKVPTLHMTGTKDDSIVSDATPADRLVAFEHMKQAERYLVVFEGGDHMVFSGRARGMGDGSKDAAFQDLIRQSSLAFWDAHLRGDKAAREWLAGGGFAAVLGKDGTFERRAPAGSK